jgi:hypothetical protein
MHRLRAELTTNDQEQLELFIKEGKAIICRLPYDELPELLGSILNQLGPSLWNDVMRCYEHYRDHK